MHIQIMTVGARPKHEFGAITHDFLKRLPKHIRVSWHYVKHGSGDPNKSITTESENIMRMLPHSSYVVLLDETGKALTSPQLSNALFSGNAEDVVFVIGGAYGVSDELKNRADLVLSLGKLVYPHQIVRLILAEQIYRAYTISINHPYHHA